MFEHFGFPIDVDDVIECLKRLPINPENTWGNCGFGGHFTLSTLKFSHHYPPAVLASGHSLVIVSDLESSSSYRSLNNSPTYIHSADRPQINIRYPSQLKALITGALPVNDHLPSLMAPRILQLQELNTFYLHDTEDSISMCLYQTCSFFLSIRQWSCRNSD